MQKTEQRAFAAVQIESRRPFIIMDTVRFYAQDARQAAGNFWIGGWPAAKREGWRIRPVLIRVEDEETTHD